MRIIKIAKNKHIIVFAVNIDSPNNVQVNIGNNTRPVEDPINRADHTEPVDSVTALQANQNMIEVGTPKRKAETIGLSFHHSDRNWAFI